MTAKQALQFFGLRDSPSVVVPEGGLLLPLIDGALTTSERGHGAPSGGGFLFPAFIQENRPLIQRFLFRYKLSSFNAARSPPMCTIAHSYGTLGRSCTQVRSSFCRGSVFARDKTGRGTMHITALHSPPSLLHVHLPGSVFLLPSAPMMTSNSSSLTGCVLGWTSALQPIPARHSAHVI